MLDSACAELSQLNPYRYRGYYYDTETGLYFLKTRYYDPEVGRFITIDDLSYIDPEIINGLNLYAYCTNNPVMNIDPNGTWSWKKFWKNVGKVAIGVAAIAAVAGGIALTIVTGGIAGAIIGGALIGLGSAALSNMASQIKTVGWDNVDLKKTLVASGVGLVTGALTGALSFGVGSLAKGVGESFGFALSQMSIKGLQVSKIYGTELLMSILGQAGRVVGVAGTSFFGDYLTNQMFGKLYSKDDAKNTTYNVILGLIMDLWAFLKR